MNILNAVFFQTTWFGCVLGGSLGGAPGIAALVWHSWRTRQLPEDLRLAALLASIGWLLDCLWVQLGVLDYGTTLAPPWIAMLWFGVALTFNHSLSLFLPRPWLGGLLAAVSAPLSYLGGERLGAITVPEPAALTLVALAWGALFFVTFSRLRRDEELT